MQQRNGGVIGAKDVNNHQESRNSPPRSSPNDANKDKGTVLSQEVENHELTKTQHTNLGDDSQQCNVDQEKISLHGCYAPAFEQIPSAKPPDVSSGGEMSDSAICVQRVLEDSDDS